MRSRLVVLALAAAAAVVSLLAGPARALASGTPFSQANPQVLIAQGGPTQLSSAVESGGQIVFNSVGSATATYNAIALDPNNGFLYGMTTATSGSIPNDEIVQIDATGAVTSAGLASTLGTAKVNVGAWDPANGYLYFASSSSASTSMQVYNPATNATVQTITLSSAPLAYDLTYAQGSLWGLYYANGSPYMEQVNPSTGAVTNYQESTSLAPNLGSGTSPVAGAAWTYGNGNLGFSANNTGEIYQISVNTSGSTPTFALVSSQTGPANSQNDGANIKGAATQMSISANNPAAATPGSTATWTYTIANTGTTTSSGYSLSDTLPSGLTNVTTSSTGCAVSASTFTCQGNPQAGGASTTVSVSATVPTPFTSSVSNTATIVPNEATASGSDLSSTTTLSPAPPYLSLTNSGPSSAVPGSSSADTFTLTPATASSGGDESNPITVQDTFQGGLSLSGTPSGSGWSCGSPAVGATTFSCTYTPSSTLAPGTTLPAISVPTTVDPGARGTATTTAVVSSSDNANATAASTATASQSLSPSVDDAVTVTAPTGAAEGTASTWRVGVANAGPSTANNVVTTVPVPSGTTFVTSTAPAGCTLSSGTITCTISSLATGAGVTYALQFTPTAPGSLAVSASVNQTETDANSSNNSATSSSVTVAREADLALNAGGTSTALPGGPVTDTFTVSDNGPDASTGFSLADTLPPNVTNATTSTAGCSISSGVLSCTEGALASGASFSVNLAYSAPASFHTQFTDSATVTGDDNDPSPGNNTASATTSSAGPLLSLTASASNPDTPGAAITYSLTGQVAASGAAESAPITITETLPGSVTVSALPTGAGWNCANTTVESSSVSCVYTPSPTVAYGTTLPTLTVPTNVDPGARGSIVANATIASADNASSPASSQASSSVTLTPAVDDSVTITAPSSASVNTPATYSVRAKNAGPSSATAVQLTVPVPSGATFLSSSAPSGCALNQAATSVVCQVGTLAPNTFSLLPLQFVTANPGALAVSASISQAETDSDASNNSTAATATVTPDPLLTLTAASPASATPGQGLTGTLVVHVGGTGGPESRPVTITEALGSGVTVSALPSGTGWSCAGTTVGSGQVSCTYTPSSPLAPGTSLPTLTVPTAVAPGARGTATASATVASADNASSTAASSTTSSSLLTPSVDDTVRVSAPAGATVGAPATVTVTAANGGPSTATGVVVSVPVPGGATYSSGPAGCSLNASGSTVMCAVGTLAPGASASLPLRFDPTSAGTLTVAATIAQTEANSATGGGAGSASAPVSAPAGGDLHVTVTPPSTAPAVGAPGVFTVQATNGADAPDSGVVVTIPVPSGTSVASLSPGCTDSGSTIRCDAGTLAAGQSADFAIGLVPSATGTVSLTATAAGALPQADPTHATATSSTPVTLTSSAASRWLSVRITTRRRARFGWRTRFVLTVANRGAYTAHGATATLRLPARTVLRHTVRGCRLKGRTMRCRVGTLRAHRSVRRVLLVRLRRRGSWRVGAQARGTRFNVRARAAARTRVTVYVQPRLALRVYFPGATLPRGTDERLKLTLRTANHTIASHVRVCDTVPAGASIVSAPGLRVRGDRVCTTLAHVTRTAQVWGIVVRFAPGPPRRVWDRAYASAPTLRTVTLARSVAVG